MFVHTGTFSRSFRRGFGNLAELYRLRPGEVVWGLPQHHIFELIHGHREWAEEMKRGGWPCRDCFHTAIQFDGLQSWAARSGARYFYSDVDSGGKLRELIHADGRYAEVGFIKEHHWMPREDVCCWMRQEEEVGQS